MTEYERSRISELQKQGYGYKKIAKELNIPVNGVKTYCRRHPVSKVDSSPATQAQCLQCGVSINQIPNRKEKRFCSDRCRLVWWNNHKDRVNRKTYYNITCPQCKRVFLSYGNKNRIYCSRVCFADARRKEASPNG